MNQNTPAPEGLPDDAKRRPDHGPAVGTGDACTGSVAVHSSTSPPRNSTISIPDHELLRRIGGGSYGEVWLARNVMGTFRAVKIVYRKSFDHDRPFEREFKGIQKFEPISRSHEGLVDILQIGRNDQAGHFYYVMELADDATGESEKAGKWESGSGAGSPAHFSTFSPAAYTPRTLREEIKLRRSLPVAECIDIGLGMTSALAHVHGNGLVHRDVKPSNIIFVNGVPKLADIGLVADISEARSFVGTTGFIPPEGPGTPQADLYSLGKVLYEISTGKDRNDFPLLPANLRELPDQADLIELNEIFLKACDPELRQRYQAAEEMRAEIELLQTGQSVKRARTVERRRGMGKKAGLAFIALALVAASVAFLLHQFKRSEFAGDGPPSKDEDATRLCAKAMLIVRGDNYAAFPEAYTNFHRAIELDKNFVRPWVGLLELRLRESVPALPPPTREEMRTITRKLMELAPNLAATYCAQAIVNWNEWNYLQAKRCILQAIKADPNYELGHTWYGFMLCLWGDAIEGRRQYEISRRLAPSKVTVYRGLGRSYYMERRYTKAIELLKKALEQEPHHGAAYSYLGAIYRAIGEYTNAINHFERRDLLYGNNESKTKERYDALRRAFKEGGVRGYWQEEWKQTEKNLNGDIYCDKAIIQIHLGNTNAALSWLEKAYENQKPQGSLHDNSHLPYLFEDECWDSLYDDLRFRALLDKMGLTKVMPPRKK